MAWNVSRERAFGRDAFSQNSLLEKFVNLLSLVQCDSAITHMRDFPAKVSFGAAEPFELILVTKPR